MPAGQKSVRIPADHRFLKVSSHEVGGQTTIDLATDRDKVTLIGSRANLRALVHRIASVIDPENSCGACGNRVVQDEQGQWIDPDEIGNAPDLCLMNEPEPDQFAPHQVTKES